MDLSAYFAGAGKGAKTRVARDTGLAYSTIHAIERGRWRPRVETAEKISGATGGAVTVHELLGLAPPAEAPTDHPEAAE